MEAPEAWIELDLDIARVSFDEFAAAVGQTVRRALVATYGVEIGTDAAAEAMRVAWERWPDVEAMANPAGFLYRVGQSQARPYLRWRRRTAPFPDAAITSNPEPDRGELADLFQALHQLRPVQRAAVVLVRSYGYTYAEAAGVLGVSEAAVTNHVHRGLKKLRQLLEVI